jgi:hypothetical protein
MALVGCDGPVDPGADAAADVRASFDAHTDDVTLDAALPSDAPDGTAASMDSSGTDSPSDIGLDTAVLVPHCDAVRAAHPGADLLRAEPGTFVCTGVETELAAHEMIARYSATVGSATVTFDMVPLVSRGEIVIPAPLLVDASPAGHYQGPVSVEVRTVDGAPIGSFTVEVVPLVLDVAPLGSKVLEALDLFISQVPAVDAEATLEALADVRALLAMAVDAPDQAYARHVPTGNDVVIRHAELALLDAFLNNLEETQPIDIVPIISVRDGINHAFNLAGAAVIFAPVTSTVFIGGAAFLIGMSALAVTQWVASGEAGVWWEGRRAAYTDRLNQIGTVLRPASNALGDLFRAARGVTTRCGALPELELAPDGPLLCTCICGPPSPCPQQVRTSPTTFDCACDGTYCPG